MIVRVVSLCALLAALGSPTGLAQNADQREKTANIHQTIEKLNWKEVDLDALSPLERCRTLMLMNHALGELGAVSLAEADLLGAFLEQEKLAEGYAALPAGQDTPRYSFQDACKISNALLKGPMSDSRYTTELSNTDDAGLQAYLKLYDPTCRDKWSELTATTGDVRRMVAYLKDKGKLKEYMAWAPSETERRQAAHEREMKDRRAAAGEKQREAEAAASEAARERRELEESRKAQDVLAHVQQPAVGAVVQVEDDGDWYPGWYNGVLSNAQRPRPYHRHNGYQAEARNRVKNRSGGRGR